jgi:hypothetical protein
MAALEATLQTKLEVAVRKGLAVDFMASEDVQVSLDVRGICDYTNAGWIANAIYRPTDRLTSLFPELTDEDVKKAACYYQRQQRDLHPISEQTRVTGLASEES